MLGSILVPLMYGKRHLGFLAIKGLEASLIARSRAQRATAGTA